MTETTMPPSFDSVCIGTSTSGNSSPLTTALSYSDMREQKIKNTCLRVIKLSDNAKIPTSIGYDTPGYEIYVAR